jgi:hypothetical protein
LTFKGPCVNNKYAVMNTVMGVSYIPCFPGLKFAVLIMSVVGLERGPLSLVTTVEKLLGRKSSGSGLESREYDRREPSR